jgi:nitrogen-specific signal transduction histidine kinase
MNLISIGDQGIIRTMCSTAFINKRLTFVSEGKQKGTGLGLTLVHCIAVEHGGEVVLLSSRPGETIFRMKVARELPMQDPSNASEDDPHDRVTPDENVRT